MSRDSIVEEVRKIRKEIENEHGNNWESLERYLLKKQKNHKNRLYHGHPKKLIKSKVA